jgi:hypothetical protein
MVFIQFFVGFYALARRVANNVLGLVEGGDFSA